MFTINPDIKLSYLVKKISFSSPTSGKMIHIVETPVVLNGPFATFRSSKRRPVHRWIKGKSNQYKHMGKWETVPEKLKPKSISFLDYKYNDE